MTLIVNWKRADVDRYSPFVRAVCEWCDAESDKTVARQDGPPAAYDLPEGWSVAPYPVDYEHTDGSVGPRYTCGRCRALRIVRQDAGIRPLLSPSPARAAAIAERRATGQRGSR